MLIDFAGLTAFLCGAAGWISGMVKTWYVGSIAAKISDDGSDIGNELALVSHSGNVLSLANIGIEVCWTMIF
jgi:hypothetical protein